jgi:hypothetical protein
MATIDLIYPPVNALFNNKPETYSTECLPVFFPFSAGIISGQSTTGTFPATNGNGSFPADYYGTGVPGTIPYYFLAFLYFLLLFEYLTLANAY